MISETERFVIGIANIAVILAEVRRAFPCEASGLVLADLRGRKTALSISPSPANQNSPVSFAIADDWINETKKTLDGTQTRIRGCFHSHLFGPARPSKHDRAGAKVRGELWLIYSIRFQDLKLFEWDGEQFHRQRLQLART